MALHPAIEMDWGGIYYKDRHICFCLQQPSGGGGHEAGGAGGEAYSADPMRLRPPPGPDLPQRPFRRYRGPGQRYLTAVSARGNCQAGRRRPRDEGSMKPSWRKTVLALVVVLFGVARGVAGVYVGEIDDAPGAALMGLAMTLGAFVLALLIVRQR